MRNIYTIFSCVSSLFVTVFCTANYNLIGLRLTHTQSNLSDESAVRFIMGATDNFDGSFDAWKIFSSNPNVPSLYTKDASDNNLSINSFNQLSKDVSVPLYTRLNVAGNYQFSVTNFDTTSGAKIFLQDLQTGSFTELNSNTTINVYLNSGFEENRFNLLFSAPMVVSTTPLTCFYNTDGTISISDSGNYNFEYELYSNNAIIQSGADVSESITITGLNSGVYNITTTSNFGYIEYREVEIISPAAVIADFTVSDTVDLNNNDGLNIINNSSNSTDYFWDFGDGFTSSSQTPSYIYNTTGTYQLSLIANNGQCSDSTSRTVYVTNNLATAISENTNDNTQIYYTSNHIVIRANTNTSKDTQVTIFDLNGAIVLSKHYGNLASINDQLAINFPAGLYIVKLSIGNTIINKKVIIQA